MDSLHKIEAVVFERMNILQRGTMNSQLAFVAFQILKLLFRDAFIITIFAFPLPALSQAVTSLFALVSSLNVGLSVVGGVALTAMVAAGACSAECVQERVTKPLQIILPWVDVLAFLIIAINIKLLEQNAINSVWLVGFNVMAIVAASIITTLFTIFNFTKEPRSASLLRRREAEVVAFCDLVTLVFCYYLSAAQKPSGLSNDLALVFSVVQVGLSLAKIKQRVFRQFYLQNFPQWVSSVFYFMELNLSLLVAIVYLVNLDLLSENLIFLLLLMTMLEYSASNAYLARRNSSMYLSSAAELKDEEKAALYLERLCELVSKVEKEEQDIILISLKRKHSLGCKNAECPCQAGPLGPFVRHYVRSQLQVMGQMFHGAPSILLSILYFKMVVFKYYPQILARLAYYSTHFALSLPQRYHRFALTQYLRQYIQKRNVEIDAVESQNMFRLQELRGELESIIRNEIQVRSKQWKYLARGLCRISELELSCNQSLKQVARVMQIFEESKIQFRKSKEFNLLLLFYFLKVSFLTNGKEIKENLKELFFGFKEDELYGLKEFRKFIYHKRSCVIETLIDNKTMGIITAASRNVEQMFGLPTNKVIGLSINNLMPQFMAQEHDKVMLDWATSGTWRTIGKLKQVFCVHKQQFCFSALLYLKLYIKDSNLHFITNIFKLNQNDFLLLTPTLKIEGLGRRFLKMLGEPAKRISLDLLVQNANGVLDQNGFIEGRTYRRVFMGLRNMETEVDGYLQRINMKFEQDQRRLINKDFHQRLVTLAQEKYLVEFSITRCVMGRINFLIVCLKEYKRIDHYQNSSFLDKTTAIQPPQGTSKDILADEADGASSEEQQDERDPLMMEQNANSSLTSLTEKENYPIAKTIEKFISYVQNPQLIKDKRLSSFNLLVVIILLLLSVIDFISFYAYKEMLLQIQGIFFADGAQSDIMQTTEIAYNYIYTLRSQVMTAASPAEIASTLKSARLVNTYVYELREVGLASLITNVTELSKDRFYSYLEKPANWTMRGRKVPVMTHQFLENMYYLSMRVLRELEALSAANSTAINYTFFNQLFSNFPQMQRQNQFYLQDYQSISDKQHQMLSNFTICSMVVYLALSMILGITFNRYFRFRFDQLILSFSFFSYVSNQFLEKMKDYYAMLQHMVVGSDKLKDIDRHEDALFQIDTYQLFHKNDLSKNGITSKIKFINYQNYYKWIFILLLFGLLNAINYFATSQIRNFFPNSQKIIMNINALMRSENKLLQAYFNLRAAYSLNPNQYLNQSLYDKLIPYLNGTDTTFNTVANELTTVFTEYDSDYQNAFVKTLTTSVCTLSAPFLTTFESTKCVKDLTLNILDGGILISMNFFQRNVRTALEDAKAMYMNKTETPYSGDYFRQLNYVELDIMLIYMFKIYQQTQAVAYGSYMSTIQLITNTYLKLTIGMTAFFIFAMLIWLRSIPAQKRSLSYLYGHLLLVPFMILKSNTRISTTLKETIEYSDL